MKNEPQTTNKKTIEQAKNYAIAIGLDPDKIEDVERANKLLNYIARQCAQYGSD